MKFKKEYTFSEPTCDTVGVGALPYMTSTMSGGRGSPKSRQKERGCVNYVRDKRGGVEKSGNFADVINGSPLALFFSPYYWKRRRRRRRQSIHRRPRRRRRRRGRDKLRRIFSCGRDNGSMSDLFILTCHPRFFFAFEIWPLDWNPAFFKHLRESGKIYKRGG